MKFLVLCTVWSFGVFVSLGMTKYACHIFVVSTLNVYSLSFSKPLIIASVLLEISGTCVVSLKLCSPWSASSRRVGISHSQPRCCTSSLSRSHPDTRHRTWSCEITVSGSAWRWWSLSFWLKVSYYLEFCGWGYVHMSTVDRRDQMVRIYRSWSYRHRELSGNWTPDLWKSQTSSQPLSLLSSPSIFFLSLAHFSHFPPCSPYCS